MRLLSLTTAFVAPARLNPGLTLSLDAPAEVDVVVADARGREVGRATATFGAGAAEIEAPVRGLASGVYHARVSARARETVETRTSRFTLVR